MSNDDIVYFLFLSIVLSCLLHVYLLDIHLYIHNSCWGIYGVVGIYVFVDK